MKKKVLSIVLAVMMILSVMPLTVFAADVQPEAEWKEVQVEGLDYAVEYTYAKIGSDNYKDWYVDFEITADKDVPVNAITLAGMYHNNADGQDYAAAYNNHFPMVAGTAYKLIANNPVVGAPTKLTYGALQQIAESFTCGIKDNSLAKDTKFTINIVLYKDSYDVGEEPITVEGAHVDEVLYVKPVAKKDVVTVDGLDYAVKYAIESKGSEYYNDWNADFVIKADKAVKSGDITLKGQYDGFGPNFVEFPAFAMEADKEYKLSELAPTDKNFPDGWSVSYSDLVNTVKEFTCGIKNNSLAEDTNFTVEIVLSKDGKSFVVDGSVAEEVTVNADVKPVAKADTTATLGDCDYAINYTVDTPASANYDNWNADILVTADKDIAEGDVTLKGQFGGAEESVTPAFTAGIPVSLLSLIDNPDVSYKDLVAISEAGGFTCGVKNEYVGEDVNFKVEVILTDGKTTFTVDGSTVDNAKVEAVDIKPVVTFEPVILDGCDYAVNYTSYSRASTNYNNWNADILITANKDVAAGDVTLKGQFGGADASATPAFTANVPVSLLSLIDGNPTVSYAELVAISEAGGFTCGVKNEYVGEDINFKVEIILTDGKTTFTVDDSAVNKEIVAVDIKPVVTFEPITLDGCDYAVNYTSYSRASTNYNNWNADILITANKDVAAGDVTLKGQFGGADASATPAFTANVPVSLLSLIDGNPTVSYAELVAISEAGGFTCGIKDNALAGDTTFKVEIVLTDGKTTFTVDGSAVNKEIVAEDVQPTVQKDDTVTLSDCDKAVKYTLNDAASAKYSDWNVDFVVTANKNVEAGAVELVGSLDGKDCAIFPAFAMTAGTPVYLLADVYKQPVTYAQLVEATTTYFCGYKNISLADDTEFTIEIVLTKDGEQPITVVGSDYQALVIGYKTEAIKALDEFIAANVPEVTQDYAPFTAKVEQLKNAINNAADKDEVDEKLAQALEVISDKYVPEYFTVKAEGAQVTAKKLNPAKSTKYEIVTVKINEANGVNEEGNWFVYWTDENGRIVSTYSTYSFFAVKDTTLTPVYVDPDSYKETRETAVVVTDIVRAEDNGNGTASFFAERSASKAAVGNAIDQHGIIWTTDEAQKGNLTIENGNANINPAASTGTSLTGMYKLNVSANEGDTVYARSYLIDANGDIHYGNTVMSATITNSDSSSSTSISCDTIETVLTQAEEIIHTVTETEPEAESTTTFISVLMNIINAVAALIQSIIALF